MAGIALPAFGGMVPRRGEQLLANHNAELAQNCLLLSGEARGLHAPIEIGNFNNDTWDDNEIRWVFQIPPAKTEEGDPVDVAKWVPWGEDRVEFLGGPLVNDMHDRYYYTRTGHKPQFSANTPFGVLDDSDFKDSEKNPDDTIPEHGLQGRPLGVPAPVNDPTLEVEESTDTIMRRYAYTFITKASDVESVMSAFTQGDGHDTAEWGVSNFMPTEEEVTAKDIDKIRIWRTAVSESGNNTDYFLVAETSATREEHIDYTTDKEIIDEEKFGSGTGAALTSSIVLDIVRSDPKVTRAYLYTVLNNFSEESAPSEPVVEEGYDDDTWILGNLGTTPEDIEEYNLVKYVIYRTVTGSSGAADYFYVGEADITDTEYVDASKTGEVSLNDPLETYQWTLPPDDLIGFTLHPNCFFVGFVGKELYFSAPYHPHAWPSNYVISTEHEIVGVGIFGSSVAVITKGHPYVCVGIRPEALSLTKYQSAEPCTHFRGIVPVQGGIIFPTFNGLKLMSATGVTELSKQFLTRDEWQNIDYDNIFASRFNTKYIGFYAAEDPEDNAAEGFLFEPADAVGGFSTLAEFWNLKNIQTDPYSGQVWMIFDNIAAQWNPPEGAPLSHIWKSKEFVVPKPINLGCFQIGWLPPDAGGNYAGDNLEATIRPRLREPREYVNPPEYFDLGVDYSAVAALTLTVWADGIKRYEGPVNTTRMARLSKGFKAIRWQFQFAGNATVRHAKFAETGQSLATI